ncbi:MAG: NusA-like transcription termination signal-binding factor [Nanoarchaeota archaeon]
MARIKYNFDVMQYISIFESLTAAKVKDCIVDDSILFIVQENDMGKAIGKNGSNIKRAENLLKKNIRLVEFSSDVKQFVRNLIYPVQAKEVAEDSGIISIYCADSKSKGRIIGRDRHNINETLNIVKRHFKVEEIKVY